MSWLQLQVKADTVTAPQLESLMEDAGAVSVTMVDAADQPLFEPAPGETPLWQDVLVTGLYPAGTDPAQLIARLREDFLPAQLPEVHSQTLPEQDWQRAWMDDFKPLRFGERLWICPSWCAIPDPAAVNILLDPGLAFGTGTHPTTALCLQWLDAHAPVGQRVLDYGCGSGILGIGALLLGATRVYGVDNDPQAILASRDNCEKNGLSEAQFETFLPEEFLRLSARDLAPVDGVLANILAEPLMQLADYLASLVRPHGWLLLSGILEKQAEDVARAYRPWFEVKPAVSQDGWVRLEARRKL